MSGKARMVAMRSRVGGFTLWVVDEDIDEARNRVRRKMSSRR